MENDVLKEITLLNEKSKKYDYLKSRIDDAVRKINESIGMIQEALTDLSPTIVQKVKHTKTPQAIVRQITDELYNKMLHGLQVTPAKVTPAIIESTYPDFVGVKAYNIIKRLKTMKNVRIARDGKSPRLFIVKEI